MDAIFDKYYLLSTTSWDHWWFPGFGELLNMISYAFWWEIAFVIAAIPVFILIVVIWATVSS